MGHTIARLLIVAATGAAAGLTIALPGTAMAMSKAKTPAAATSVVAIPLTSDGHHYRAIVFGGSCEEGLAANDFHGPFIQISSGLKSAGWDVYPFFAGDSSHCSGTACPKGVDVTQWSVNPIAQAAGKDPSTVGRASKASLLASLDQAASDLATGDELLLVIDTHGYGEKVTGQTYWDHGICVSSDEPGGAVANFDPASGQMNAANKEGLMYMSDADLQQRLQKLASKGVKMGFLDDSCYGGGSLPQLSTYGCTMASTTSQLVNFETGDTSSNADGTQESENGIAYNLPDLLASDSNSLEAQSLNPNKITMEELWLRVLARSKIAGIPEYSGYAAESAQAESLGNWMYSTDGDVTYRRGTTPFTTSPNNSATTPAPLVDYAQTYLKSVTDPQATDENFVSSYWVSPGAPGSNDLVSTKALSALQSQIAQTPTQWASLVNQYNVLAAQESKVLASISSSNIQVQWTFDGALAGTSDLMNAVVPTISQHGVFTYQTSLGGNPWLEVGDNLDTPDSPEFAGNTKIAANSVEYFMNAYKLQHDHFISGLPDSDGDALGAMIVQAETQAWNAASSSAQTQLKSDFQQLKQLRQQETLLLAELVNNTRSYLTQARMYAYLRYRNQAALLDPKVSQCSDFVLKRY